MLLPSDVSRYEQACDQAIAMCDGNLRSTIKALIMANEYLEAEMQELQAANAAGALRRKIAEPGRRAATPPDRRKPSEHTMADVTYYVALPFLQDDSRLAGRRSCGRMPEFVGGVAARRSCCPGRQAASARSPSAAPAIP